MNLVASFAACETPAQFYRVQIAAEDRLGPSEILALQAERAALPEPARAWLDRLVAQLRAATGGNRRFERHDIAEQIALFRGPQGGARRHLLLVFCGILLRPMMPLPVFLQHMPARGCDVAVLRDPQQAKFLLGLPGYAEGVGALAERLRRDLAPGRYDAVRTIGISSGGAAALAFGRLLGAGQAVAVCGQHPAFATSMLEESKPYDGREFDRALRELAPRAGATRTVCVFGEAFEQDRLAAAPLLAAFPGAFAVHVPDCDKHNLLLELRRHGMLERFLAAVVRGRFAPGAWS